MTLQKLIELIKRITGIGYHSLPHVGDEELMEREREVRAAMRKAALVTRREIRKELRRTEAVFRR